MSVGPVSSQSQNASAAGALGGLTQNEFLDLMVAQLQNQDPLNPVDTTSFLQEMAAFTEVVDLQNVLSIDTETAGVSLIGKTVSATDPSSGQSVSGTVTGVDLAGSEPMVTIGSTQVPLTSITQVT